MGISAKEVNNLRKSTGAGMMDCKKALEASNGDFDAAVDYLRKKGQKVSAKRAEREANEGVVKAITNDSKTIGVLLELNCETDFVAKNDDFQNFADDLAQLALTNKVADINQLMELELKGTKVATLLEEQVGKIGEKIEVSNLGLLEGETIVPYTHLGSKIGVLVSLNQATDAAEDIGRDVAMQIAAMNPLALDESGIPQADIDRELEVAKEQIRQEGKPENLVEQIAKGKLNKFFKERTLLKQAFVKDNKLSVEQVLKNTDAQLKINAYVRFGIGA